MKIFFGLILMLIAILCIIIALYLFIFMGAQASFHAFKNPNASSLGAFTAAMLSLFGLLIFAGVHGYYGIHLIKSKKATAKISNQ